jgi:hypothetical protein
MSQPQGSQLDKLQKIMIPMIRKITPGLMAQEIVGVQPMSAPIGLDKLFKMKTPFEVERATVKNSDAIIFFIVIFEIIVIFEDAGKEKDDPRKLGIEILAEGPGILTSTIFKEDISLTDTDNGFKISNQIILEFKESVDDITIGADISHKRMMALINSAVELVRSTEIQDPAVSMALTVANAYFK